MNPRKIHKNKRDLTLDLVRGTAVIVMIIAHSVAFFHDFTNPVLLFLMDFGNTVAFSTFLFVSGAVAYVAYVRVEENSKWKRVFGRVFGLLIGYYVIAFIGNAEDLNIVRTLLLLDVPGFTEFILAFVLYGLLLIPFERLYKLIAENIPLAVILSVTLYLLGTVVNPIDLGGDLNLYKALFAGHEDIYRFPVLQYFPLYILGLQWGRISQSKKTVLETSFGIMILSSLAILLAITYTQGSQVFDRWPPAPMFLLTGVTFVFTIITIISLFDDKKTVPLSKKILGFLGTNAFPIYIYQTITILTFAIYPNWKFKNPLLIGLAFLFVISVSSGLAVFEKFIKNYGKKLIRKV